MNTNNFNIDEAFINTNYEQSLYAENASPKMTHYLRELAQFGGSSDTADYGDTSFGPESYVEQAAIEYDASHVHDVPRHLQSFNEASFSQQEVQNSVATSSHSFVQDSVGELERTLEIAFESYSAPILAQSGSTNLTAPVRERRTNKNPCPRCKHARKKCTPLNKDHCRGCHFRGLERCESEDELKEALVKALAAKEQKLNRQR